MECCPCCNARLKALVICPRCKADFSVLNSTEHMAQLWLTKAIHYWVDNETERSLAALELSLHLKKTRAAATFQGFIIQQQCQNILDLLAQKQLLSAKQCLYKMRHLFSLNKQLQQLNLFADYLLVAHEKVKK